MADHEVLMKLALEQAKVAFERREVPVGCIIVRRSSGVVVARGSNQTNEFNNGTRHCEVIAIEQFLSSARDVKIEWSDYTLYVTVEPCVMCAAALRIIGLTEVVYGCQNDRFGGCDSVMNIARISDHALPALNLTKGILKEEAVSLLQLFYERGNAKLPETKRHRRTVKESCIR
jgi:tRNA-specific adenosine deaminase 2